MIRFYSFLKNTASVFRVTNVSGWCWSDTEDKMCQLFSLIRYWKIVRGVRICTGPMGIQICKDARASLSPYWLWKILLAPHVKHPQTAICNGHISLPVSHQRPYEWIQSPSRRRQLVYRSWKPHDTATQKKTIIQSITALKTWQVMTIFKTRYAMYVSSNIVARSLNHFATKTQQCILCVLLLSYMSLSTI